MAIACYWLVGRIKNTGILKLGRSTVEVTWDRGSTHTVLEGPRAERALVVGGTNRLAIIVRS
jgi:hypothetical protein